MPAAAATCTRISGETEAVSGEPCVRRRALSSAARRRIISTSAGLRRLFGTFAIRGVILQGSEPLISLRGDGENPRCIPEVRTPRSEEQTSELQSRQYLVCRL